MVIWPLFLEPMLTNPCIWSMVGHCTVKIPPVYLSTQCHWDHYIKVGTETNWHIKLFETFKNIIQIERGIMLLFLVRWIPSTSMLYRFVEIFVYRSILKKEKYQRLQASIGYILPMKCLYAIGLIVRDVLILVPQSAIRLEDHWSSMESSAESIKCTCTEDSCLHWYPEILWLYIMYWDYEILKVYIYSVSGLFFFFFIKFECR